MDALQRWLTLVTLASAALAASLYLARQVWRAFKVLERIAYELSPNHGSSMKDDLSAVAIAVGQLQGQVRDLATGKDAAHQLLQLQIDGLTHEVHTHHPQHKTEREAHQ